jgi:hypothetical protein
MFYSEAFITLRPPSALFTFTTAYASMFYTESFSLSSSRSFLALSLSSWIIS